ncbi:MAG: hypothetical protein M3303_09260 [Gemmatimonadota bacterium]|nr:hypothetical protein [Gemmatimonadota bacterium]
MTRGHLVAGALALLALVAPASSAAAQGHGPVFGLSTPTLRKGGWSLDAGFMGQVVGEHEMAMFRPMVSYGITEDVQISASLPLPIYTSQGMAPARVATRMPASPDVELTLGWRFDKHELGVGSRFESTAYVALAYPTDATRMGLQTAPGVAASLTTGYVSRTLYAWVGGMYRRYMTPVGVTADRFGDLAMYSVVLGYRPPAFQHDYPHADWRLFVEAVGEVGTRDVAAGVERSASGGHGLFVGPTLLGLYGGWGISGGPLFPVYQRVNGDQPREHVRLALDLIFWF